MLLQRSCVGGTRERERGKRQATGCLGKSSRGTHTQVQIPARIPRHSIKTLLTRRHMRLSSGSL